MFVYTGKGPELLRQRSDCAQLVLPPLPACHYLDRPAPSKRPCVPRGLLPLPSQSSAEGGEVLVASHPSSHEQGAAVWAPGWGGSMLFLRLRVRRQKELMSCHDGPSHRPSGAALVSLLDSHPLAGPGLCWYLLDAWGDQMCQWGLVPVPGST